MKFKNTPQFRSWREKIKNKFTNSQKVRVKVCITGCRANGAIDVFKKFQEEAGKQNLTGKVEIVPTGCQKFCSGAPVVTIELPGVMYQSVSLEDVSSILDKTVKKQKVIPQLLGKQRKFLEAQKIRVLKNCGDINPLNLEEYIWKDGFSALEEVLSGMSPEEVIEEVKRSGLRGRGGAGFPTGLKWEITRTSPAPERFLICNGDEGDPGAFMDRSLLEGSPFQVIEGMLIGAYAIGANSGYLYVRAEYPIAIEHLTHAISECYSHGILGKNILGTEFSFDLQIKEGAGAFVCGEETALIASIEGKRGMPRPRPPFPAESGLWGKPTCINNVETFANIPIIIQEGWKNFASVGTERSSGTKIFSLAGKVKNTGLVEVPFGTSIGEVVFKIGGGALPGCTIKGVQTGGPSGGCIPVEKFSTPIDYENLDALGSIMGSGGMIVVDDKVCMVEFARYFLDFVQKESCGKCVPCRIGTKRMLEILERITKGQATLENLEKLEELANIIKDASLCGLGQTAPNPVLTTLKYFRDEYIEHIAKKRCSAGVCRELVIYFIDEEECKGCGACKKVCPAEAIEGDIKKPHRITIEKCIKCGACYRVCKFGAINVR